MTKTQIVCTLGPASEQAEILAEMLAAGMDMARLNFSHGTLEDKSKTLALLREVQQKTGKELKILADLQGPKIRLGNFPGGGVEIQPGQNFTLHINPVPGSAQQASIDYPGIVHDVQVGTELLIDDGKIKLEVTSVQATTITCQVKVGGVLKDRKGVNIPGASLRLPGLTDKDRQDLGFILEKDVDWVAISFVRTGEEIAEAKKLIAERGQGQHPKVMAKIETREAIKNLPQIIDAADGVMVARGDLAIEIPLDMIPLAQKVILKLAEKKGKFAITATQMLESMTENQIPTRAEITDVANAVLDGTGAVMLSAESAVGAYPVKTVQVMDNILNRTERALADGVINLEDLTLA